MNDFNIYLTFDIDQDFNPSSADYYNRSRADFKSFQNGFLSLIDKLREIPFSVFLRADRQIKSIYGSYEYLLENNQEIIREIIYANGEINWHAHLYKGNNGKWVQIKNDNDLVDSFLTDHHAVKNIKEINTNIVRIGECVMSNSLMQAINGAGISIDSSALPGRKRNDSEKEFNWELTNNLFYNPSIKDYRISADMCYDVTEVPMSTLLMKTSYDKSPIKRYFNLSFKPDVLFQKFSEYVEAHSDLVIITHPFEVLSAGRHELISYDMKTFENNILTLKEQVIAHGKRPVFKKMSEIISS